MIYFNSDYMAGAHSEVLEALCDTNLIKKPNNSTFASVSIWLLNQDMYETDV